MIINSKVYDILKWIALVFLDAVGLFYQTIAEIWTLPYGDNVLKTCVALSVLLGALLGVSNSRYRAYNDAHYELSPDEVDFEDGEADVNA